MNGDSLKARALVRVLHNNLLGRLCAPLLAEQSGEGRRKSRYTVYIVTLVSHHASSSAVRQFLFLARRTVSFFPFLSFFARIWAVIKGCTPAIGHNKLCCHSLVYTGRVRPPRSIPPCSQ